MTDMLGGDVHIDVESTSVVDLPAHGADVYWSHPDTYCILFDAVTDDDEIIRWTIGEPVPRRFYELVLMGYRFIAHGQTFEKLAFAKKLCQPPYNFPMPRHWDCSMLRARYNGLPASLAGACAALGVTAQKDLEGQRLMQVMCKPRNLAAWKRDHRTPLQWWHEDPAEAGKVERLHQYCLADCYASRELWRYTRPIPARDWPSIDAVIHMNERGVGVDLALAKRAVEIADLERARINHEIKIVTEGRVDSASKVAQLKAWLQDYEIPLESLDKREVQVYLTTGDVPKRVRDAIELRLEFGKASVSKYNAMLKRANVDARITDSHVWHGAGTGRLSSQGLQTQNFRRDVNVNWADNIHKIKTHYWKGIADMAAELYGRANVFETLSTLLRPTLMAQAGRRFVGGDLSQIEARITALLADDQSVLDVFRSGLDLYRLTASQMFHAAYDAIQDDARRAAKVSDLALGFGGAVKALQSMARNYNVEQLLNDDYAKQIVHAWREARPLYRRMWQRVQHAAWAAVLNPGLAWQVDCPVDLSYGFNPNTAELYLRLPSRRIVTYRDVRMEAECEMPWIDRSTGLPAVGPGLWANGVNSVTKHWESYPLTSVVLVENAVQAIAADVMFEGLVECDRRGWEPVLSIHDELVNEPPPEKYAECNAQLQMVMTRPLDWLPGVPLGAKVWTNDRYTKGE